uniref:CSON010095 protein n=1 Tax=Culicoides sonorensis TaxID=179676 RepID=A0A336K106_CULSO
MALKNLKLAILIIVICFNLIVTSLAKPGFSHADDLDVAESHYANYGGGGGYVGYAIVKPVYVVPVNVQKGGKNHRGRGRKGYGRGFHG